MSGPYQFQAMLKKTALTIVRLKEADGEVIEVPKLTVTLEFIDVTATDVSAALSGFHGSYLQVLVSQQ